MKRFFYFSVSVLCLALASFIGFYIGSQTAEAQDSGLSIINSQAETTVGGNEHHFVLLSNGDLYERCIWHSSYLNADMISSVEFVVNIFEKIPPKAQIVSFQSIKSGAGHGGFSHHFLLSNGDFYRYKDGWYFYHFFEDDPPATITKTKWEKIKNQFRDK